VAYDCLLVCDGNWEKLVIYGMLTFGFTYVIGAIAGGLYGLMYGFGDVPRHMLKHELSEANQKLGIYFFEKFVQKKQSKYIKKYNFSTDKFIHLYDRDDRI